MSEALSETQIENLKKNLAAMRSDPVLFVRKVIKAEPTKQQEAVLRAIATPGAKVSVKSGHGTGKSTCAAWEVLRTVALFPFCKVPCTAPTSPQLRDVLWAEIAKWHQRMDPWFREQIAVESERVYLKERKETQFAVARTARKEQPEALQGFHADELLFVIDEASGVPEPIFEVAQGALSTANARVLMMSNPTQTTGFFFQSHHRMKHRWKCLTLSCVDSPLADRNYIKDIADAYGEDSDMYRIRVKGEFPKMSVAQLISREVAEKATLVSLRPDQIAHAPVVLGVDVAWHGDDRSAVFKRQGLNSQLLGVWRNMDNMTLGGLVAQMELDHKADGVFIDMGWGTGVIDYLRSIGRNPVPVAFGGSALKSEEYLNKRTEMWFEVKKWLEDGGCIPNEINLIEDLVGPQYYFAPSGKKGLERKEDMKKRGLCSPDLADALALTFAAPTYAKLTYHSGAVGSAPVNMCQTEYDPLAF